MSPRTNDNATPDAEKATPDESTVGAMPAENTAEATPTGDTADAEVTTPVRDENTAETTPAGDTAEATPVQDSAEATPAENRAEAASDDRTPTADSGEDTADVAEAPDERVVAVRRLSASQPRWRTAQLSFCAAALAVAMTAGAVVLGALRDGGTTPAVATVSNGVSPQLLASGDLDASIASLQAHLRTQPKDFGGWSTLGLAYVEQARTKGDPSRYPQAQQALDRSLKLRPDYDPALAGRAALAAARHDFTGALKYADLALEQNPYSERALSSRIDALVELGRYDEASKAADLADSRRPGVPVFTRYAYVHELRGDVKTARRVLRQALATATSRGDISYVATALGQLAWSQGEYDSALTYFARALAADDGYLPALEGRARTQAAQGDRAAAIKGMEQVVQRYPFRNLSSNWASCTRPAGRRATRRRPATSTRW